MAPSDGAGSAQLVQTSVVHVADIENIDNTWCGQVSLVFR